MEEIILASASPRRETILRDLQFPFKKVVPQIDENEFRASRPRDLVRLLAQKKVEDVQRQLPQGTRKWILGVDTVVVWRGKVFGKPKNVDEARNMLHCISGNVHQVISGIVLLPATDKAYCSKVVTSKVKFRKLTEDEVDYYLETGEWKGVAGGYRIQQRAAFFIEWIKGSYSNIVGLPISVFYGMLRQNNYNLKE